MRATRWARRATLVALVVGGLLAVAGPAPAQSTAARAAGSASRALALPDADVGVYLFAPASVLNGGSIEYTLNLANDGPDAITTPISATLQLPLDVSTPPSFNFWGGVSCSFGAGGAISCYSPSRPTVSCTFPGSGGPLSITCSASDGSGIGPGSGHYGFGQAFIRVNSTGVGTATATATLVPDASVNDANAANNTATATTTIAPMANLGVTATAPGNRIVSEVFSYAFAYVNNGPNDAAAATLSVTLPAQVSVSGALPAGCTGSGPITCALGTVASGAGGSKSLTVQANSTGDATATATISSATGDSSSGNNSSSATTTITTTPLLPGSDLEVSVTPPAAPKAGEFAEFTYTVLSRGPDPAANVVLTGTLPAGAQAASLNGAGCALVGNPITSFRCTYATLANADTRTVRFGMYFDTPGTATTAAAVTTTSSDPDATNNSASASVTVAVANADRGVYLTAPSRVLVGGTIQYTLTLGNTGPDQVYTPISATFQLPAEVSASPSFSFWGGTSCSFGSGGAISCYSPSRPTVSCSFPGGAGPRSVTCSTSDRSGIGPGSAHYPYGQAFISVTAASAGTATATATLAPGADVSDPSSANNTAVAATRIFTGSFPPEADLELTQTAPASARPGDTFAYTITVRNNGPDTASPVTVTDTLPAQVTYVSASGGTCSGASSLTCNLGSLALYASTTLTINVRATTEGTAVNAPSVSAPPADLVPGNDSASSSTAIRQPQTDLTLTMTGPASAVRARQFTYAITVHNGGPDNPSNVRVHGTLPAGLSLDYGNFDCFGVGGGFECFIGTMYANQTKYLSVNLTSTTAGSKTTTANVTENEVDPIPSDNTATVTTTITEPPRADLAVTIDPPAQIALGGDLDYTVTVTNLGPDNATGLTINSYFLTAGFDSETATPDMGACGVGRNAASIAAGSATMIGCSAASLAVGASWLVVVHLHAVLAGTYEIGALAVSGLNDPDRANDIRSATTVVSAAPSITCPANVTAPTDAGSATAAVAVGTASGAGGTAPVTVDGVRSDGLALGDPYPLGTTTVTWTATDAGGQTATCSQTVTVEDDEAPATTATASGTPQDGWYQGPVAVHLAATDNSGNVQDVHFSSGGVETTTAGAAADVTVAVEGETTITFWAVDAAGNTEVVQTLVIRIDSTPPVVTCDVADGVWHGGDVSRACSAADGGSGLGVAATSSLSTDVAPGTETADASTGSVDFCDRAGNCATAGPLGGNQVDRKAPDVTCAAPDGVWHADDVALACSVADLGSGIAAADGSFLLSTTVAPGSESAGAATGQREVCDAVGNCTTAGPIAGNRVDRKLPTVACAAPDGLWHGANVALSCTASDGGSGIPAADAAFTLSTTVADGAENADAGTGSRAVCDGVGNCTAAGPIAGNKVDRKRPVVTCAAADGIWYAANVSLACDATDSGAGLSAADQHFLLATTVAAGQESATAATAARSVCDAAGNCSTAGPIGGNRVDRKAPTITIATPAPGATFAVGARVLADYRCTDLGSGPATCAGTVASGAPLDTATIGARLLTVTATDAVGNSTTEARSYRVTWPFAWVAPFTEAGGRMAALKAGGTAQVDFTLGGNRGLDVFAGPPTLVPISCTTRAVTGPAVPLAKLRLKRDHNEYSLDWKTEKSWASTCGRIVLTLADGTVHSTDVQFRKGEQGDKEKKGGKDGKDNRNSKDD